MEDSRLLAGVSQAIISPPVGLSLLGTVSPSIGVHDDLYARTLVLSDGVESVAIVCLDLVGLALSLSRTIREKVHEQTDIPTTLLCCSHNHSAPFTMRWSMLGWTEFDRDGQSWREELIAGVVGGVVNATENLQEASVRAGRTSVQIGFNRRLPTPQGVVMRANPDGPVVLWVDVLRLDDLGGHPVAILFSHAAHAVAVHSSSTLISADYPGFAVAQLRQHFGDKAIALFVQGCCGNINVEPLAGGLEAARQVGRKLGRAAARAACESELLSSSELKIRQATFASPLQDLPTPDECEAAVRGAEERVAQASETASGADNPWCLRDNVLCLQDLLEKARRGDPQELPFEISSVTIGDQWCVLAMPHEIFAQYQLWVDQVSPFKHTMVAAYTNGCESYVPTDADLSLGGYEAASFPSEGAALRYSSRVALKPGIEPRLKKAMLELWV